MSDRRGALVSVSGSSLSSVAGISVRQAFFAPAIGIAPDKAPLPRTRIESIRPNPRLLSFAGRIFDAAGLRLCLPARHVGLEGRLQPVLRGWPGPWRRPAGLRGRRVRRAAHGQPSYRKGSGGSREGLNACKTPLRPVWFASISAATNGAAVAQW